MDQFIDTPGPSGTSQAIDLTELQPLDLTSGSLAPEQPKKRRRGMTEADRRALRRYKQFHPNEPILTSLYSTGPFSGLAKFKSIVLCRF